MPVEQFERMITEIRNKHVVAGMQPLMVLRSELIANDEFLDRGGTDNPTQGHLEKLLLRCDLRRRHVTHNPDGADLGDKIVKAIDPTMTIDVGEKPFGGDDIQNMSGGKINVEHYWKFDGTDPNIPVASQIDSKFKQGVGGLLLGAIDAALVEWTRCNSRDRSKFITRYDSMRIYGAYQEILGAIRMYLGDANRVDVAQVLPSDEPLGPTDSPNIAGEHSSTRTSVPR